VLVERFLPGSDYRLLVVGERLVAAARREPPLVIGDGKHTVRQLVDKVNAAVKKTVELPDVRKRIEDTGSLLVLNTPEEFAAQIRAEYDVYKKVVQTQKLTLE